MKATTETHEERFKDALMCYISEFDADFSSVFTYYFHSAAITAAESVWIMEKHRPQRCYTYLITAPLEIFWHH